MPRTGKKFEWEVALQSGIPLAATIQDFDWADEVLQRAGRGRCLATIAGFQGI